MALIVCKDCSNQISDSADKCPHCGRPITKYTTGVRAAATVLNILLAGGLLTGAISLWKHDHPVWAGVAFGLAIGILFQRNK